MRQTRRTAPRYDVYKRQRLTNQVSFIGMIYNAFKRLLKYLESTITTTGAACFTVVMLWIALLISINLIQMIAVGALTLSALW